MPLGFERINERSQRPNQYINFIKPLEGPDKAVSEEYLSRIAAQCVPVMKQHRITVMALEEHAPNPEFLGRNFNAGEVIQLVLKDKQGRWLPFKFVQMVMMHELAHCKQMNHSRFFWNVRNEYAKHMEDLWRDGYAGEGLWGRGRGLEDGTYVNAQAPDQSQIPEHLCGGSYRRRGRKRKRGQQGGNEPAKLSYAERQQKRIQRKYGKHGDGESLGEDELVRGALQTMNGGKRAPGKPRVANSKRGRELRANAALARFGAAKQEKEQTPELTDDMDSETDTEWEDDMSSRVGKDVIIISDDNGRELIKVDDDGEDDEGGAGREMDELRMLSDGAGQRQKKIVDGKKPVKLTKGQMGHVDSETESDDDDIQIIPKPSPKKRLGTFCGKSKGLDVVSKPNRGQESHEGSEPNDEGNEKPNEIPASRNQSGKEIEPPETQTELVDKVDTDDAVAQPDCSAPPQSESAAASQPRPAPHPEPEAAWSFRALTCPICSLENEVDAPTCMACANVLRPNLMPNHWRCQSDACKESKYLNAGDAGRCGLCGSQKPKTAAATATGSTYGRPVGITRPEVLRWD